ncbi:MAG: glycosyltransferase family 2 protein [Bacteroidia bacterium]
MVSIIIINYNTFDLIVDCILSIKLKVVNVKYEIIVVDNASADDSARKLIERFPDIKVVVNNENLGFSKGNNVGISNAIGDQILLLNSDTVFLNNALEFTKKTLEENPQVGIVTCSLQYPNGQKQHNCQSFPSGLKLLLEKTRLFKLLPLKHRSSYLQGLYFNYDQAGAPDWVWGTYFHFKRSLLDAFPERKLPADYFMYVEDLQWCYLARKAGWKIAYNQFGRILHLMGQSKGETKKNIEQNQYDFIHRYYSYFEIIMLKFAGWKSIHG